MTVKEARDRMDGAPGLSEVIQIFSSSTGIVDVGALGSAGEERPAFVSGPSFLTGRLVERGHDLVWVDLERYGWRHRSPG